MRGQRYPGAPPSQHGAVRAGRLAFQATLWRRAAGPLFQRGRRAKPQKSAVPSALGTMLSTSASMPSSLLSPPSCLSASTLTQRGGSLGLSSGPGPTRLAVSHRHTVPSSEPVTRQPLARCCEIVVTPFACCCSANRHSPRCSLRVVRGSSQAGLGLGLGLGLGRRRRRRQRRRRRRRRRRRLRRRRRRRRRLRRRWRWRLRLRRRLTPTRARRRRWRRCTQAAAAARARPPARHLCGQAACAQAPSCRLDCRPDCRPDCRRRASSPWPRMRRSARHGAPTP